MRFKLKLAGFGFLACSAFLSNVAFAQNQTLFTNDLNRARLLTLGKAGLTIALARGYVLDILQSENSCSAWLKTADPDAAETFASLNFFIEAEGPRYVLAWRPDSEKVLFKQPYGARTQENAGQNSAVLLNANGPFFVRCTSVLERDPRGFVRSVGTRFLQVGPYSGDTLGAQMITLLHEFGHVVGNLPDDSDTWSGQSNRNTAEVLHFCQPQIKVAERKSRHTKS